MSRIEEAVVGGVRLSYEVHGSQDNPKMVLLHGLGDRGSDWATVADHFAESFEVFAPDLRGHGDSDWPGTYSFDAMFNDVTGLLDHLRLHSVVLVGHSMGGNVAYLMAQKRPDLVRRLIIEDVTPPYPLARPVPVRPDDAASLPFDWALVPAIVGEVVAGMPELWAGLPSITAPTLLVGGGTESHIPQDKLQEVADVLPICELVTISAGHDVHATEPDQFIDVLDKWLGNR